MGGCIPECFTQCFGELMPQCFPECLGVSYSQCIPQCITQLMGELLGELITQLMGEFMGELIPQCFTQLMGELSCASFGFRDLNFVRASNLEIRYFPPRAQVFRVSRRASPSSRVSEAVGCGP